MSISFDIFTVFKKSIYLCVLGQISVTNEHMHRQAVTIFEDTMKKISSDLINSLNIGNYERERERSGDVMETHS